VALTSHLERMQRAASALCASPHDAEDLVQETCVRVLSRSRKLDLRDEVPYLMRALRNTYLTSLRTASRRPRTVALPPGDSAALASSNTAPHVVVERNQVLDAVATLPDDFRRALVAVEIVGLSHRDAAHALGGAGAHDHHPRLPRPPPRRPRAGARLIALYDRARGPR
jgi:RNA polymerase sigma-70 factor, ECF subfamily